MKKVVVTGAHGLIGWHAAARLHAANCAARFRGEAEPVHLVPLDRAAFNDASTLNQAVEGADGILHFAGINRAEPEALERDNIALAQTLSVAVASSGSAPAIVYANSTHAASDTPYGRGKAGAAQVLRECATASGGSFCNVIIPHVFGEAGRPFYNNVTGTLCHQIAHGETPTVNPDGKVELVHAGAVSEAALRFGLERHSGDERLTGTPIGIPDLCARIKAMHSAYAERNIFPDISNAFDLALFNTYRQHLYPDFFPRKVRLNSDARGTLFETIKANGGGQSFVSTTLPGVTRGEHFHLGKVERFMVLQGEARIEMRRVLTDDIHRFAVAGDEPAFVDMPTLWTHNITNVGDSELLTLFWTHELFDPSAPDTFADPVGGRGAQ